MRFVEVTKGYIVDVTKIRIIKCAADKTHNDGRTVQNNLMHIHIRQQAPAVDHVPNRYRQVGGL